MYKLVLVIYLFIDLDKNIFIFKQSMIKVFHIIYRSVDRSARCESCGIEFTSKSDLTHHVVKYQGTCNPNKSGEYISTHLSKYVYNVIYTFKFHIFCYIIAKIIFILKKYIVFI